MAEDAVGVAEELVGDSSSAEVSNFNTGALAAIYTGGTYTRDPGTHTVGDVFETSIDGTDYPYVVSSINRSGAITGDEQVIAGAGTRTFFLGAIGETSFNAAVVANETGKAAELDNDANADLKVTNINDALAGNSPSYTVPTTSPAIAIVPFSGAQLIMQEHGLTASTLGNADFPAINGETLDNGVTGSGAAVGSLQEGAPEVTYGKSTVGDFDRYVWCALPTSDLGASGDAALVTLCEETWPSDTTVWTNYGFVPVGAAFPSDSSNWIHTIWQN